MEAVAFDFDQPEGMMQVLGILFGGAKHDANRDSTDGQDSQGPCHDGRRIVRMMASFFREPLLAPECPEVRTECVKRREECGGRGRPLYDAIKRRMRADMRCRSKHR